jgi:hypothetical protein
MFTASTARRTRVGTPLLTLLAVAAIAAGVVTGFQSLQSGANAGAVTAVPAPTPAINDPAGGGTGTVTSNGAARPLETPDVAPQACKTMAEAANRESCGFPRGTKYVAPRATWLACEAMDAAAYRELCLRGDGGRWIEGSAG